MIEPGTASRRRPARPARAAGAAASRPKRLIALATGTALLFGHLPLAPLAPAQAQQGGGQSIPIVRDAEIEELLREYMRPILAAAGLRSQNIQAVIVNDRSFNAFVADGRRIFVNVGALFESETPNQIIGVLAHETGHIAGGHLSRMREQMANAQTASIVAILLGLGAAAAGAAAGASGVGQALPGLIAGPQELVRRSLLSYVRQQEAAADIAAVNYLNKTRQSARGMLETFQRMADQTLFLSRSVDPYTISHPMPRERIIALENAARKSPHFNASDSPELRLRHNLMRAKISGYTERPDSVARRYPPSDTSLPARYARAISDYRTGNLRSALPQIDTLIAAQPSNAYFHELRGRALVESGQAQAAIASLRRALSLRDSPLIRMSLGQALVQSGDRGNANEAVNVLRRALQEEPEAPLGYRQLAFALGRAGDRASADLASAQASFHEGDLATARQLAARAQRTFRNGSPEWLRAQDIVEYRPPQIGPN
jgi:predicted Zn-dependent protease